MCKRLLAVCFAITALHPHLYAQFTDPHQYDNSPIGVNQLELAYAYARSNASVDTSLIVTGAKLSLNQGSISYTRYFGLLHRLFWVEGSVPIAGLSGSVTNTSIHGTNTGVGDSSYQIATLLKGGPALDTGQFENYHRATTLGLSLTVTAPTGSYNPHKVLNLG